MTARAKALLDELLRLPEKDRARMAAALLASIDDEPEPGAGADWAEELERRARKAVAVESRGIPWSTVRSRLKRTRK